MIAGQGYAARNLLQSPTPGSPTLPSMRKGGAASSVTTTKGVGHPPEIINLRCRCRCMYGSRPDSFRRLKESFGAFFDTLFIPYLNI